MSEQDIDIYLSAKNKWSYGNIVMQAAYGVAAIALIAAFIPSLSGHAKYLGLLAFFLGTSTYGAGHRSYISKDDLLALIERHINANPDLIARVSQRKIHHKQPKRV